MLGGYWGIGVLGYWGMWGVGYWGIGVLGAGRGADAGAATAALRCPLSVAGWTPTRGR